MKRRNWKEILAAIPPGLTFTALSRRVGAGYHRTRAAVIKHGYAATDGRHTCQHKNRKVDPAGVDWTKRNIQLSKKYRVSRERIRQLRLKAGKPLTEN